MLRNTSLLDSARRDLCPVSHLPHLGRVLSLVNSHEGYAPVSGLGERPFGTTVSVRTATDAFQTVRIVNAMTLGYWGSIQGGAFLVSALKRATTEVFRQHDGEDAVFQCLKEIDLRIYGRKRFRWMRRCAVLRPKTEDELLQCVDHILCPTKESPSIPERILHDWYETRDPRTQQVRTMYFGDRSLSPTQWLDLMGLDAVKWFSKRETVYHDSPDCPRGRQIREDSDEYENWIDGTGGWPRCEDCQSLMSGQD